MSQKPGKQGKQPQYVTTTTKSTQPPVQQTTVQAFPKKAETEVKSTKCSSQRQYFDIFYVLVYLFWVSFSLVLVVTRCTQAFPAKVGNIELQKPICDQLSLIKQYLSPFPDTVEMWKTKIITAKIDVFVVHLLHQMNMLLICPSSLILVLAFLRGSKNLRIFIGLINSTAFLLFMAIVDALAFKSFNTVTLPSHVSGPLVTNVVVILGFWSIFPVAVLLRLWGDLSNITDRKRSLACSACSLLCKFLCLASLAAVVLAYYELSIKTVDSWKRFPSVMDHGSDFWQQTAPYREQFLSQASVLTGKAIEKSKELGEMAITFARHVGKAAIEKVNSMRKPAL